MKKLLILFSIFMMFSIACSKSPTLPPPPPDPCSNVTPPRYIGILYPNGHVYHPSVFLEMYVWCVDCEKIQVLDNETVVTEVPNEANSFVNDPMHDNYKPTRIFVKRNSENLRLRAFKNGCPFDHEYDYGKKGELLKLNYTLGTPSERSYIKKAKAKNWSIFIRQGSWHQSIEDAVQWWNKPEWNEGVVHLNRGGTGFPINIYIFPREEDLCFVGSGCAVLMDNQCKVWLEDPDGLDPMIIIHEFGHCIMVPYGHSPDTSSFMSTGNINHLYFPPEEKYWFKRKNS